MSKDKEREAVARMVETPVGADIFIHGVEIPSWPLGTEYDDDKRKVINAVNAAARSGQDAMREALQIATRALEAARSFIRNGVELGYIKMPDADCPDPAHMTPTLIDDALAALAAHPAPEATNWKAAYEQEAQKFRAETLHTSDLHQMLLKWMKLSADRYGCTADTWVKPCVQCDLMRETKAVLERPINTQPEPRASQDAARSGLDALREALQALVTAADADSVDEMIRGLNAAMPKAYAALAAHPAPEPVQSQAARDVLAERQRQITAEGWTPEHDDMHSDGSLALAAACYALNAATWADRPASIKDEEYVRLANPGFRWPWAAKWWKPKSQRRDLIRAGALILAEIERLDRTQQGEKL